MLLWMSPKQNQSVRFWANSVDEPLAKQTNPAQYGCNWQGIEEHLNIHNKYPGEHRSLLCCMQ